ncbi:MAG: DUF3857 domain-containing protein [Bacteroidota bacterium]
MLKRVVYILLLVVAVTGSANAQFNRKRYPYSEEERKELFKKYIKEDAFDDEVFESNDVPEKWKNESMVVLGRKMHYQGDVNPWTNIGYLHFFFRTKIKLQDKYAVETYSEYYFDEGDIVEIYIQKPDGTRTMVDLDDAIEVKENIPNLFLGADVSVTRYKKLAIPGLEPGDIIDVYSFDALRFNRNFFHWTDPINPLLGFKILAMFFGYGFSGSFENEKLLHDDVPVAGQKVSFDLGRNFYLNFRSLNGAPEIEEKDSKKRKRRLWVFTDGMRDRMKDEEFSEPFASLPAIKYEITFANNREKRKTDKLIDRKNKLKTTVNEKDIKKVAHNFLKDSKEATGDIYYKFYKTQGKKIKGNREFIEAFYNHYRTTKLFQIARQSDDAPYDVALNNADFVKYMVKICRKRLIDFTLIAGVPSSAGGMGAMIGGEDLIWGIKMNIDGEEIIYTDCDFYAQPGEVNPAFEGIKLYEIKPASSRRKIKIDEYSIAVTKPSDNQFKFEIKAEFQDDLDTLKVKRNTHLKGMPRYRFKARTFSYENYFEKVKEQFKADRMFANAFVYERSALKDDNFLDEEEIRIQNGIVERYSKIAQKNAKGDLRRDYVLASHDKLTVKQNGLEIGQPDIIFDEEYRLVDLLDSNGGNVYILKIGEFIDGQIELNDKDERERQGDIVFPYSRSFVYDIELVIPGGMRVSSIEALNRNVENETGSFVSTAKLEGSTLKIHLEKIYKGNFHTKDKWEDLLKFIDEAVDFRSVKLILSK